MDKHNEGMSFLIDCLAITGGILAVFISYRLIDPLASTSIVEFIRQKPQTIDVFILISPLIIGLVAWCLIYSLNPFSKGLSYGDAEWATLAQIKKMGLLAKEGLILAVKNNRYIRVKTNLSLTCIAPPGSGKTAGLAIPLLFSLKRSMLVHDVKRELYGLTSKRRSEFGPVKLFSPTEPNSHCFNPFDKQFLKPGIDNNLGLINQVATMLIREETRKVDNWIGDARILFKTYALYLIWKNGETSLPAIRAFSISTPEPKKQLLDIIDDAEEEGITIPEELRLSLNRSASKPIKEFDTVHGTMTRFLDIFAEPNIKRTFSNCDISIPEIRSQCTTVYLHVPVVDIERLSPLISIFCEMVGNHLLSHKKQDNDQEVFFLLDEFIWLGKMDSVLKLPSLSRSEGVSCIFIFQSYSQAEGLYGKAAVSALKGTCGYQIILPQNEFETAEEISRTVGEETRTRKSTSRQQGKKSTSESAEGHRLIKAQSLLSMKEGTCIILAQNHFQTPILAKQCRWFEDNNMKNLNGSIEG